MIHELPCRLNFYIRLASLSSRLVNQTSSIVTFARAISLRLQRSWKPPPRRGLTIALERSPWQPILTAIEMLKSSRRLDPTTCTENLLERKSSYSRLAEPLELRCSFRWVLSYPKVAPLDCSSDLLSGLRSSGLSTSALLRWSAIFQYNHLSSDWPDIGSYVQKIISSDTFENNKAHRMMHCLSPWDGISS